MEYIDKVVELILHIVNAIKTLVTNLKSGTTTAPTTKDDTANA